MEPAVAAHKVFVVEDSPAIRGRIVELLSEMEAVSIVGEAESPEQAVAGILRTLPDCVVLDFRLAGGTGVDVMRVVHPVLPSIGFIVLTNHPGVQYRRACMEAGAMAFLDKSTELGKLKERLAECMLARVDVAPHDS